jgi:hypothetical protein
MFSNFLQGEIDSGLFYLPKYSIETWLTYQEEEETKFNLLGVFKIIFCPN